MTIFPKEPSVRFLDIVEKSENRQNDIGKLFFLKGLIFIYFLTYYTVQKVKLSRYSRCFVFRIVMPMRTRKEE